MLLLENCKVIELASVLAGPSVGQFLAELGAEVIKVENPATQGDVTRSWQIKGEQVQNGISAYFASVNWGKTSVFWNLQNPSDFNQLYDLVKQADIVIASYKPGDAEKLKVSYTDLQKINPAIIYGHITGYGNAYDKVGYDAIIQAEAGFMYMNGEPDSPPTKMPVALIDVLAGHQLKQGILLALLQRERTGRGSYVEVSLFDSAVSALVNQASNWLNAGHIPQRMGSQHPNIVPYGTIFTTQDQKLITLAVGTDKQFAQLCSILGIPEMAENENFATNAQRVKNAEKLLPILQEKIAEWQKEKLLDALHKAKIPAGGVNTLPETFALPFSQELLFESNGYKGIRQWIGKINGNRGKELQKLPTIHL
ncbi:CaiB/BaiF CoA transferase family protein [Raineya orbicola]|uniref:Putative acyl-CoA transferases/carnitine dehydratase n=1 Tax=Raineya orbicola TaxID=2016530 RepID=A0A2N3IF34_9BACT|nr:CaiB/BaiF CoA-transferase family protein [Raineya orbicola]PKQ68920.1 putative acyl-CoA transferases/carnitine dehydratase [Raineya orbicola]